MEEGINWSPIDYFNNKIVCDVIESKVSPPFFLLSFKKIINGLWVPRSGSGVLLKLIGNYIFYIDRNLLVLCVFWMMFVQLCMLLVKELMQLFLRYLGHMYNKLCSILILVTLTSVCVLSILFSVHILKC